MAEPNFANRTLYHGDNLDFLRGMNSGTVHLIATDPPFNKSKDFPATPDSLAAGAKFDDRWSWQDDLHDDWLIAIQRDYPEVLSVINNAKLVYGYDMAAFLCFMGVRLLEMRRVLRDDGSIYLHIDHSAQAYVKFLMDAVFGRLNFRSQIAWRRNESGAKGSQHKANVWGNNVEYLLFYTKGNKATFDPRIIPDMAEDDLKRKFPKVDENGERYNTKLTAWCQPSMGPRPNLCYPFHGITPPYPSGWRLSPERMEEEYRKGNIVIRDGKLERRSYAREYLGVSPGNLWTEAELLLAAQSKERTGYPTQKPLSLYERIISASSKPGDIVLDPFCGCATTPIAAERLGRQWVGMDLWDQAHQMVLKRLAEEKLAVPDDVITQNPHLLTFGSVIYATTPPVRTDGGETAAEHLATPINQEAPRLPAPRTQHGRLLDDTGAFCQGCGRDYSFDPRVLEVDHRQPKADGGTDAYENLTLLCPPCNKEKRDRLTLTGLQEFNRRNGYLKAGNEGNIKHGRAGGQGGGRRPRRRR